METAHETIGLSIDQARKIMGDGRVYGPEEVNRTIEGFDLTTEEPFVVFGTNVPDIGFSEEELHRAAEFDQSLLLVPANVSMRKIFAAKKGLTADGRSLVKNSEEWRQHEFWRLYGGTAIRSEWVLIGNSLLPGSLGADAIDQTHALADYTVNVFGTKNIPDLVRLAVANFYSREDELRECVDKDAGGVVALLNNLHICRHFMVGPHKLFWLFCIQEANGMKPILADTLANTKRRITTHRRIVRVGNFAATTGPEIDVVTAAFKSPDTGTYFCRSALSVP